MSGARLGIALAALALGGWLLYLLAPVLTPFLVSALLAYIGNPLVARLAAWRVPRVFGVIAVFLLFTGVFTALVFYLVPVVGASIRAFAAQLPTYYEFLLAQLPRLQLWLGIDASADPAALRDTVSAHWEEIVGWAGKGLGAAGKSGLALVGWLVNLTLIPVLTFYLLLDWPRIVAAVDAFALPSMRARVRSLARETDAVLGSFLRGQLLVMTALAGVYSLGLWMLGLELALPIGLLAGAVSFVPYLGFIVGLLSAGVAAYLQFHDPLMLLWVLGVFGVGQTLESVVLTPRLVGDRIGLHPVAVIFAIMAGGQLFGFFGVLLALPAAAALKVWLRHAHEMWAQPPARGRRR